MKARLDRRARREKARHQLARDDDRCPSVLPAATFHGRLRCQLREGHDLAHLAGVEGSDRCWSWQTMQEQRGVQ